MVGAHVPRRRHGDDYGSAHQHRTESPAHAAGGYKLARYDITDVFDDGAVEFDPATKTLISDIPAPTVAEDNRSFTVDLPTLDGYLYVYGYFTHADGEVVEGEVFHNTATVNDEIVEYGTEAEARAGGSADATRLFSFDISKVVENEGSVTVPDAFDIVATSAADGQDPYPMSVPGTGEAISSKYFPAGSPVEICEIDPGVAGAAWTHTFSGEGVVVDPETGCATINPAGGTTVEIVLTNTFEPVMPGEPGEPE